ncbi:hypothetical protein PO909_025443 [Leuciscus waleckii]
MDDRATFVAIAQEGTEFFSFTENFIRRAVTSSLDDETFKLLFWIGANFHQAIDLPNTDGLNWREAISRCLVSVASRSREQPPSPAAAEITLPESRPAETARPESRPTETTLPESHPAETTLPESRPAKPPYSRA